MSSESCHKRVSLLSATLLSATSMIGSGWLFSAQLAAQYAGNWAFLAWVGAALLVFAVGLCLCRVVIAFPVRGVNARSGALSHNSIFGMPFAFANWFGIMMVVATEAQATTQYLAAAIDNALLVSGDGLSWVGKGLALVILFVYLVVNFYGVRVLASINNAVSVLKVLTPLLAIVLLLVAGFQAGTVRTNFISVTNSDFSIESIFPAIVSAGLIYSFNGFQAGVAFTSEIHNPRRNVPLSIGLALTLVTLFYLGLQLAFMAAVPEGVLQSQGGWQGLDFASPLYHLSMLLGLHFLSVMLLLDSAVSPSATGYTFLGVSARMLTAMSESRQMPHWISKLDPVHNISRRSLLMNWLLASIALLIASDWAVLMIAVTSFHVIGYMAAPVSMGAIAPGLRWFGILVFALLGHLLVAVSSQMLFMVNLFLTVLVCIYCSLQWRCGPIRLLIFVLPFVLYLWFLYMVSDRGIMTLASVAFYLIVTSRRYVIFCLEHRENDCV